MLWTSGYRKVDLLHFAPSNCAFDIIKLMRNMMTYRIVKKHYRDDKDGGLRFYFIVEELERYRTFFRRRIIEEWVALTEWHGYADYKWKVIRQWQTEEDAWAYIKRIEQAVPPDLIITPNRE